MASRNTGAPGCEGEEERVRRQSIWFADAGQAPRREAHNRQALAFTIG